MEFLSSLFYFIIALGLLVTIHEWGHFMAAKLTGMRSDIFSFGMGRRLFGWNVKTGFSFGPLPKDHVYEGKTDWRVSLFPVGGYVKIVGMIDESFDSEFESNTIQPYEFRAKNAFQKFFVISAGVIMNIVLAVSIFSFISFKDGGFEYQTNKISYVRANTLLANTGLLSGDEIISIDGTDIKSWHSILSNLVFTDLGEDKTVIVNRNGEQLSFTVNGSEISSLVNEKAKSQSFGNFLGIDSEFNKVVVGTVFDLTPAKKIGLKLGDTILYLDNQKVISQLQFPDIIDASDGRAMNITWKRGEKIYNSQIKTNKQKKIGISYGQIYTGPYALIDFGFFKSLQLGVEQTFTQLKLVVSSIKEIIRGNIDFRNAVGGPKKILEQSGKTAKMGVNAFLSFVAMLSISLALMNVLPIPALDGGHLVIILIEAVLRRELSLKTKLIIQNIGFYLLILFMIVILYIDFT